MNRKVVKSAFITSIPVMAGYIFLGIGMGILLKKAGYGIWWAFIMSVTIYAGAMQYVAVDLLSGGASLITAAITAFMVNARHLFYSISMINKYRDTGKFKPYLIFATTDETYSILVNDKGPKGENLNVYRFFVSLFNQSYWIIGCTLGTVIGGVLPFSTDGIDFSMTALFVASFTEQWLSSKNHFSAATGIIASIACLIVFGPNQFLIPAMLLITVIVTLFQDRALEGGIKGVEDETSKKGGEA